MKRQDAALVHTWAQNSTMPARSSGGGLGPLAHRLDHAAKQPLLAGADLDDGGASGVGAMAETGGFQPGSSLGLPARPR